MQLCIAVVHQLSIKAQPNFVQGTMIMIWLTLCRSPTWERERGEKTREKPWMRTICGVGTLLRRSHDCSFARGAGKLCLIDIDSLCSVCVCVYISKSLSAKLLLLCMKHDGGGGGLAGLSVSKCSPPSCAALWCGHPPPSPTAFRPLYLLLKTGLFHTCLTHPLPLMISLEWRG